MLWDEEVHAVRIFAGFMVLNTDAMPRPDLISRGPANGLTGIRVDFALECRYHFRWIPPIGNSRDGWKILLF